MRNLDYSSTFENPTQMSNWQENDFLIRRSVGPKVLSAEIKELLIAKDIMQI